MQAHGIVFHGIQGGLGHVLHLHEPLQAELGLNHRLGPLRGLHDAGVLLDFNEQPGFLQIFGNLLARRKSVLAHVEHRFLIQRAVVGQNVDNGQVVLHAQLVVVQVVRRRHFQRPGTEVDRNVFVKNHRYFAAQQRYAYRPARQVGKPRVVGVHGHGHVGHNRFGPRRGHGQKLALLPHDGVVEVVHLGLHVLGNHLLIGNSGATFGVPVHHAHAPVNQALIIQVDEHAEHGIGQVGLHGEAGAVPVAGRAELLELLQNNAAVLVFPGKSVGEELLAGEVTFGNALLLELGHYLGLGGNAGVVGAGHPAGFLALHARPAHQHVLNRIVEHVPHVEHAGHVGRRDDNGIGRFLGIGFGLEKALLLPTLVPFGFNVGGRVSSGEGHRVRSKKQELQK